MDIDTLLKLLPKEIEFDDDYLRLVIIRNKDYWFAGYFTFNSKGLPVKHNGHIKNSHADTLVGVLSNLYEKNKTYF